MGVHGVRAAKVAAYRVSCLLSTASRSLLIIYSSVVPDRERGTNIQRSLRGGGFIGCFGLLKKMDGSLIVVVR